jgi:hypothetical protein
MRGRIASTLGVISLLAASPSLAQQPPPVPPSPTPPGASPAAGAPPPAAQQPPVYQPPATDPARGEPAPLAPPPPPPPGYAEPSKDGNPVKTKWNATFYGWVQMDAIYDSTQSYAAEGTGAGVIARSNTYTGEHDRLTLSYRNTRLGFRLAAPELAGVKTSALIEIDLAGNQPPGITETAFWTNPTPRGRQGYLKLETDYIDVLAGQTWGLFAWQTTFHPNTVEVQGMPGQVFTRSPQIRLSHTFKTEPLNIDVAVAAVRPPQRDAGLPDGQAGIKFGVNPWKGQHIAGTGGGVTVDPLSIGISGLVRRFEVVEFVEAPVDSNSETGWGVSFDGLIPIIPQTSLSTIGALTLLGSLQTGSGFADQYSALTGGIAFPAFPATAPATPATANIDAGLVTYDAAGTLHTIDWTNFLIGAQYFLPPAGNVWLSVNYSHLTSGNIDDYGANLATIFTSMRWNDVCLFWAATPAVRVGAEYAYYKQTFADDSSRGTARFQLSGLYLF